MISQWQGTPQGAHLRSPISSHCRRLRLLSSDPAPTNCDKWSVRPTPLINSWSRRPNDPSLNLARGAGANSLPQRVQSFPLFGRANTSCNYAASRHM